MEKIELRWLLLPKDNDSKSTSVLQYRILISTTDYAIHDNNGYASKFEWSEWIDVPTVEKIF